MKLAVKEIAVDTAILSRDIGRLESLLTRLESGRRKMTQEIQELNTMWQGPSNQAFNIQFQTDCGCLENMCKTIREMIQAMEQAKTEYDLCDNKVKEMIVALRV